MFQQFGNLKNFSPKSFLGRKTGEKSGINRKIQKYELKEIKEISNIYCILFSIRVIKIKLFLVKIFGFFFFKKFLDKKQSIENEIGFSARTNFKTRSFNYSNLRGFTGRIFFFIIKRKGFTSAINLIENLLALKNKIKIILVGEKKIFHDVSSFCKFKKLQKRGIVKKIRFFSENSTFSGQKECLTELKKMQKIIGKPEIGKMGFLIGLKEEKNAFLKILYRLGFSKLSLKVF